MAVTLVLGPPGGGKSYEAVKFHVLPALKAGRRVVTNLPLSVPEIEKVLPGAADLIEIREAEPGQPVPFSRLEDWHTEWRHAEHGFGVLFVVDECHFALPRGSSRRSGTPVDIENWFSMHRHLYVDVVLLTQSYGKVSKHIVDLAQMVIRVKKLSHLGFSSRYVRRVQDEPGKASTVKKSVVRYEKAVFRLYQSYTLAKGAGQEASLGAKYKVFLEWRMWIVYLGVPLFLTCVYLTVSNGIPIFGKAKAPQKTVTALPKPASDPGPRFEPSRSGGPISTVEIVGWGAGPGNSGPFMLVDGIRGPEVVTVRDLERRGYGVSVLDQCQVRVFGMRWSVDGRCRR